MILKERGQWLRTLFLTGSGLVWDLDVVVNDHAVVTDGDSGIAGLLPIAVESRGGEIDVIGLP